MTRTQQLTIKIQEIYQANKVAIDALPRRGANGGSNAAYISGWDKLGIAVITEAANNTDMPVLNYWSGSAPTPSSALPEIMHNEIMSAYNKIFKVH